MLNIRWRLEKESAENADILAHPERAGQAEDKVRIDSFRSKCDALDKALLKVNDTIMALHHF
jgi:hypothetical protein